jgi:pseudouridine-5'-phosphate glycosidase
VFATGGIGGIHRNWNHRLDVSADLRSLATTPTCVVTSGAKSILDLHATVEALETIGVPLLGLQCNRFPRFIEQSNEEDPSIQEIETEEEIASICNMHWNELQMPTAVIAAVPVPSEFGLLRNALQQHVEEADEAWRAMNVAPATRTPFILDYLVVQTQGDSLRANIALLLQNASKAAKVACAISNSME